MALRIRALTAGLLALLAASPAPAEWTNRYPKVAGFSHHVYLEGYNLPIYGIGPTDPAVSPDGRGVALSARGWLWLLDLETRTARRLTRGAALDARPAWSPDGRRIAFVRDDGRDTAIHVLEVATGTTRALVDTPAMDLDPTFTRDGSAVLFASGEAGDIDLWRVDVATGARTRLTSETGLELQPVAVADGAVAYLSKQRAGQDTVSVLDPKDGSKRALVEETIASQMRLAASPDGRRLAVTLPGADGWDLWLVDLAGGARVRLTRGGLPLTPAFDPGGAWVYFVEADDDEQFRLHRIPATGGTPEEVSPLAWEWGARVAEVEVRTRRAGSRAPLPTRLAAVDGDGHPVFPDAGPARFDSQNGILYAYSPGVLRFTVPEGDVSITAASGLLTVPVTAKRRARAGEPLVIDLELSELRDPASGGWYGGDLHWHLNYGGPFRLTPEDVLVPLAAERLDVATPMLANLDVRFSDEQWWGWRRPSPTPIIEFAQEVRSHFLGHVGLVGIGRPYFPWYWGPGYPVYGRLDLPNADALRYARAQGGIGIYVHPVVPPNPFPTDKDPFGIPLELVPDAVLGDVGGLELACLWSDELGTSELWYRLLDLGIPVAPTAGSDAMPNLFRIMAIGSTRVYVKTEGPLTFASYLEGLRAGRSFVTTGPMLTLTAGGSGPGGVVTSRPGSEVECLVELTSATPVERVELLVNGRVVWTERGLDRPGSRQYRARVRVPAGGWVAARAAGGPAVWPVMDSYPFAHTAPVWFGSVASRDPEAARRSASDLLRWLVVAEKALESGYANADVPRLRQRFAEARARLEQLSQGPGTGPGPEGRARP